MKLSEDIRRQGSNSAHNRGGKSHDGKVQLRSLIPKPIALARIVPAKKGGKQGVWINDIETFPPQVNKRKPGSRWSTDRKSYLMPNGVLIFDLKFAGNHIEDWYSAKYWTENGQLIRGYVAKRLFDGLIIPDSNQMDGWTTNQETFDIINGKTSEERHRRAAIKVVVDFIFNHPELQSVRASDKKRIIDILSQSKIPGDEIEEMMEFKKEQKEKIIHPNDSRNEGSISHPF